MDRTILVERDGTISRTALRELGRRRRAHVGRGEHVVLDAPTARSVAAAISGLDGWAGTVELVGPTDAASTTTTSLPRSRPPTEVGTGWRIHTSGTSGHQSWTDHSWMSLTRGVRRGAATTDRPQRRWGLLYPSFRMAGLQMIAQAVEGGDVLIDPSHLTSLADQVAFLVEHGADALSATPTRWRHLLRMDEVDALRLSQVTLGGEAVDQPLIDALRARFGARVTHVYASTEVGSAFAVNDGLAGFPDSELGGERQVRDGMLYVHAPASSAAGEDGYVCTGDLVSLGGGRVRFEGRRSGAVNVGGVKVSPEAVERVLRLHPGVDDAVAKGRRNAFSGSVVVAQVVPADLQEPPSASELRRWVRSRLTRAHVPAVIALVPHLDETSAGKAARA
jgi:acyl-coenzyme A synthetase/AMP-(fatty) acid ligase